MNWPILLARPLRTHLSPIPKPTCRKPNSLLQLHQPALSCRRHQSSSSPPVPPPPPPTQAEKHSSGNSYAEPPENLSQNITSAERTAYDHTLAAHVRKQSQRPWLRDGADDPPVERIGDDNSSRASSKGKLLTTPSRMLKLLVPLVTRADAAREAEEDGKRELEPLALLVHPQQPLSYLERLIQSELPPIRDEDGKERIPGVSFRAPDSERDSDEKESRSGGAVKKKKGSEKNEEKDEAHDLEDVDTTVIDGKRVRTGKLKSSNGNGKTESKLAESSAPSQPKKDSQNHKSQLDKDLKSSASFSLPDPETNPASDDPATFVRWSASTEIGDFIRDAARAKHFALDIEGAPHTIMVGVPSFHDRTYYLRMRLRQKSLDIARYADIKRECDDIAESGAKRVAIAGGCALVAYWFIVYMLTFRSSLGWDVMEPVTYLVGLSSLIGGYVWFLFHNRQVSYRSAMNFTISRRQSKLYEQKGFNLQRWDDLVDEGNKLRREIKMIAEEYDVEWNEREDAKSDKVIEVLEKERKKKKEEKEDKEKDEGD